MTDWRTRHPFTVGQKVKPRAQQLHPVDLTVSMRGEDALGPWIVINDGWQRIPAELYEPDTTPEAVT